MSICHRLSSFVIFITDHQYLSSFVIVCHHLSAFSIICRSLFVSICRHLSYHLSSLPIICLSLFVTFVIICHRFPSCLSHLSSFVVACHRLSSFVIVCHRSSSFRILEKISFDLSGHSHCQVTCFMEVGKASLVGG